MDLWQLPRAAVSNGRTIYQLDFVVYKTASRRTRLLPSVDTNLLRPAEDGEVVDGLVDEWTPLDLVGGSGIAEVEATGLALSGSASDIDRGVRRGGIVCTTVAVDAAIQTLVG